MSVRLQNLCPSAVVLVACWCAAPAGAQLASTSPFLPAPGAGGVGAPTPGAPLEYRGMLEGKDGALYRIVDPSKKIGAYVRLNEREPNLDFVVKQHDGSGDNDTVVVEQAGRTFTLPLRSAKVVSSGAPGQGFVPPPPQATNMPPAIVNSVVVNPTPADEQRRLEAVAAEVARRRALREQATQQINQGVPVAPQVIPQQQELRQQNAQPQNPANSPRGPRGNTQPNPRQRQ